MDNIPFITADERLQESKGIKGVILGKSGIGKTSLLWTLDSETTLFFDLEAGDLAIDHNPFKNTDDKWPGTSIRPQSWEECRDFACMIGGPNKALSSEQSYSQKHYDDLLAKYGSFEGFDKFETVFVDSITEMGRMCFKWSEQQPESFTKQGEPDKRATYGLYGLEMIAFLKQLQHTRNKSVWFVGILDEKKDEFGRINFEPQIDGSKVSLELPGIVDEVITLAQMQSDDGTQYRAFVCHTINNWNYLAKDRSGKLEMVEEPDLGKLMKKIKG